MMKFIPYTVLVICAALCLPAACQKEPQAVTPDRVDAAPDARVDAGPAVY